MSCLSYGRTSELTYLEDFPTFNKQSIRRVLERFLEESILRNVHHCLLESSNPLTKRKCSRIFFLFFIIALYDKRSASRFTEAGDASYTWKIKTFLCLMWLKGLNLRRKTKRNKCRFMKESRRNYSCVCSEDTDLHRAGHKEEKKF